MHWITVSLLKFSDCNYYYERMYSFEWSDVCLKILLVNRLFYCIKLFIFGNLLYLIKITLWHLSDLTILKLFSFFYTVTKNLSLASCKKNISIFLSESVSIVICIFLSSSRKDFINFFFLIYLYYLAGNWNPP